jgi:hypothetical protein
VLSGGKARCSQFCTTGMDGGMSIWDVKVRPPRAPAPPRPRAPASPRPARPDLCFLAGPGVRLEGPEDQVSAGAAGRRGRGGGAPPLPGNVPFSSVLSFTQKKCPQSTVLVMNCFRTGGHKDTSVWKETLAFAWALRPSRHACAVRFTGWFWLRLLFSQQYWGLNSGPHAC